MVGFFWPAFLNFLSSTKNFPAESPWVSRPAARRPAALAGPSGEEPPGGGAAAAAAVGGEAGAAGGAAQRGEGAQRPAAATAARQRGEGPRQGEVGASRNHWGALQSSPRPGHIALLQAEGKQLGCVQTADECDSNQIPSHF